jgi:oligogalacturonide transporter
MANYLNSRVYKPRKIDVKRGVGFGMLDLMGGGWNNIVSGVIFTFLMYQGIDPMAAGSITGIGRVIDALFSLFIGGITDNFYKYNLGKRFGRRHFFILFAGILFACIFPLFWLPVGEFWFYLGIYIAIEIIIAFILIPWETLPTEMTEDYNLRTILSASRMFISATGTSLVFIVLAVLKNMDNPDAYLITGIIWTVIFVIAIFISWGTTWERQLTKEFVKELDELPKLSIWEITKQNVTDYFSTFKNRSFRKHLAIYLFSFTGKDFYATMLPTFIVYALLMNEGSSWTLFALAVIGIPATLLAARIMIKQGPKFLFTACYLLIIVSMVGYLAVYFLHIQNPMVLLIVISCVFQIGRATLEFTPWNVFPFIPDVDRIMTKESKAGIYAAVMTFFRKSTGALASWVAGFLLAEVGFVAAPAEVCTRANSLLSHVNKAECGEAGGVWGPISHQQLQDYANNLGSGVQNGIALIFFIAPVVLIVVALIVAQTFKLNKHTHKILTAEIHRLEKGGSKESVDAETKSVVEELTGVKYSELWPDGKQIM